MLEEPRSAAWIDGDDERSRSFETNWAYCSKTFVGPVSDEVKRVFNVEAYRE